MSMDSEITRSQPERRTPASGTHDYLEADSTISTRFGKDYRGGRAETFDHLKRLYAIDPVHVVRPVELIKDSGEQVRGYRAEEIDGQTVQDYLDRNGILTDEIKTQIRETIGRFHAQGEAHGDINKGNIMVAEDGTVKFTDPVGYEAIDPDDFSKYAQLDWEMVDEWLEFDYAEHAKRDKPWRRWLKLP